MDPNETLRIIRLLIKQMKADTDPEVRKAHADELVEHVEALDGWLDNGGFWPDDWAGIIRYSTRQVPGPRKHNRRIS